MINAHLFSYTGASFADNTDSTSQIGWTVFLGVYTENANLIAWSSVKSKRVSGSALAAKKFFLATGVDEAIIIKEELNNIYSQTTYHWP